jgi:iron complex outermembrane recepter protein
MQTLNPNIDRRGAAFAKKPCVVATGIAMSLMAGHYAYAQEEVEKIEVTGTRLPPKNIEAGNPVTIITAEDIKLEGVRTIENLINNLPQVFADQGSNLSNGSSGTANLNLRNLGNVRTLVLVNGRRLPPGDPNIGGYPADVNNIPVPLVARVEVLTGGTSGAVYGSDAVAGVVNFVMNDKFQGVQVNYNNSFYNHNQQGSSGVGSLISTLHATNPSQFSVPGNISDDGKTNVTSLLMGSNFADGRGNATVYFGYQHTDPVLQGARDFSACTVGAGAAGFSCGGSSTSNITRFTDTGNGGVTTPTAGGGLRPFNNATDLFNYGALNYFQRPDERYNFSAFAHYDVTPMMKVYSEFMFMDDHTVAQIAPSGAFGSLIPINSSNPLLTPAEINQWFTMNGLVGPNQTENVVVQHRNIEGGDRLDDIRHTTFRGVVGMKGDLNKTWTYDISQQWGQTVYQETYLNDLSKTRIANALDVVANPAGGAPVCRSVVNGTDPNCVPWNLFSPNSVTPAAAAYLATPGLRKGSTTQTVSQASIAGDLGDYGVRSPWAKDGLTVVAGAEYRKESLQLEPDEEFQTFDLAGQGGAILPQAGQTSYKDLFGEFRIPFIEGRDFFKLLELHGTYRYSQLSSGGSADSYSADLSWSPIEQVKFRAGYARAVRAPNIVDLFAPQGNSLFNMTADPCAGAAPTATLAQCANTGVTAAQYGKIQGNAAGQYNQLVGGNPNLRPESSDTYTAGVVLTPIKNLSFTADYYDIRINNEIAPGIPAPLTVNQCIATANPLFCGLITRDSLGTLWLLPQAHVTATNLNIASSGQTGVDLGADYRYRLAAYGSLQFNMVGTVISKSPTTPIPGLGSYDCVGLHGATCGVPTPRWRHKAYVNWQTPWNANLRVQWRHINAVDQEGTSSNPQLNNPGLAPVDAHWGSRDYIDLAGSWQITKIFNVSAGVNNVFDRDPPLVAAGDLPITLGSGNTYPNFYDAMGRLVFVNLQAKF